MLTSLVVVPFEDGCHRGASIGVAVGQTQSGREAREGSLLVWCDGSMLSLGACGKKRLSRPSR